jgi:hypothetical protein
MLKLPQKGFRPSTTVHNCDLAIACDWLEASVMACETEISRSSVSDILFEQQIYQKDRHSGFSFCSDFIDSLWAEMRRRERLAADACLFKVSEKRILRRADWTRGLPGVFLMILCCIEYYEELNSGPLARKFVNQGELFEDFCRETIGLGGWVATRTGWSSSSTSSPQKLVATVKLAADALREHYVNESFVEIYSGKNEAGCDMVAYLPYDDSRTGRPVALIQCASGANFKDKLGTPSIDLWRKFIAFSTIPLRGFCTPRAFGDEEFKRHAGQVDGVFLDRHRLLSPFAKSGRLSPDLSSRLSDWLHPRIKSLPILT